MAVPSFLFLAYAAIAALLYAMSRSLAWRAAVMLLVNLGFLLTFCHKPLDLVPYLGFLVIGFGLIRMIASGVSGRVYALAVAILLAVFFWLKHYSFIPAQLFLKFDYTVVGLSYVFFRVVHLAIAAHEEPETGRVGIADYINYTLNFTALTSGPIQSFEDYKDMTGENPASLSLDDVGHAIERIVAGMFQFSVLATLVALLQHAIAGQLAGNPPLIWRALWMALLTAAYPIFLFFNFSGYTSFVIGVARFFRLELPENFNHPFRATSFIDYWSRWHMSLSNWLKAHVYNPMVLNAARRIANPRMLPPLSAGALFITFFLIGIWHGRAWHFFFFGFLNGAGVAVNQFYRLGMQKWYGKAKFQKFGTKPIYVFACRGITFGWVAFTLLWFWSDWPELNQFAKMLGPIGLAACTGMLIFGSCVVIAVILAARHAALNISPGINRWFASPYFSTIVMTLMLLTIIAFNVAMAGDTGEVVYKGF